MKSTPLKVCSTCIEAIKSKGEKIIIIDTINNDYNSDNPICEWCNEEVEEINIIKLV